MPDWLTNVLGVQSLTQFGAAASSAQHTIQNDIDWSKDCGAFISSTHNSQTPSSVVWVKDNLAVVPEEYENSGIGMLSTRTTSIPQLTSACSCKLVERENRDT